MTTYQRKAQIAACRAQGAADRDAGKPCNYQRHLSTDEGHRWDGWQLRDQEIRNAMEYEARNKVANLIDAVEGANTRAALRALHDLIEGR